VTIATCSSNLIGEPYASPECNTRAVAEDPTQAGMPRTRDVTRTYETDRIRVFWDATRCIHTAICLNALPGVFDVRARPWIDLSGADAEDVAAAIRACPTGALRYEPVEGGVAPEAPDEPTTIDVRPNGPLFVRGRVRLTSPRGDALDERRAALCRCGASENKPYCDNSHRLIGFRD
jgi:uncharacterized Fe-S cluster protein YjdI